MLLNLRIKNSRLFPVAHYSKWEFKTHETISCPIWKWIIFCLKQWLSPSDTLVKKWSRGEQRRQHSNDFHFSIVIKFLSERFFFKLKIENIGGKIITMKTREEEMRNVFLKEATKRYSDTEKNILNFFNYLFLR